MLNVDNEEDETDTHVPVNDAVRIVTLEAFSGQEFLAIKPHDGYLYFKRGITSHDG